MKIGTLLAPLTRRRRAASTPAASGEPSPSDVAGEAARDPAPPAPAPPTPTSLPVARAPALPRPVPSRPDLLMTVYLASTDMAVSFADPALPDAPLIHVNDAFCALTDHPRERCVGRNCRFLQGEATRRSDVDNIRRGIAGDHYLITRLLNYRRDGQLFDNVLQIGQVRDTNGDTQFLFGLQWDVTTTLRLLGGSSDEPRGADRSLSPQLRQLARLANHLVRRSTSLGVGAAGIPMVERLVAMSRPFQFPTAGEQRDRATLRSLLEYLVAPRLDVPGTRLRIRGTDGTFSTDIAGPLALWLHELASASRQYGALSDADGVVILSWGFATERGRAMIAFNWREIGLAALPGAGHLSAFTPENLAGGNGARVVREIVEFAGGRSVLRERGGDVEATLLLPNDGAG